MHKNINEVRSNTGKLSEMNWLRGFAAICVVLYHYTTRYQEVYGVIEEWSVNVPWGCGAVNTFFILSGFLTALTLRENTSVVDFVKKRAVRLYPAYWVCIILTALVTFFFLPTEFPGFDAVLINFTMLQSFLGIRTVDGAYWTLMYELQFYICIAVILLFRKAKWLKKLALIGTIMSTVLALLTTILGDNLIFKLIRFALLGQYGISFFGGILLHSLKNNFRDLRAWAGIVLCAGLSWYYHTTTYFVAYIITVLLLLVVVIFHTEKHKVYLSVVKKLDERVLFGLSYVASISFPLYLLHQNIGRVILNQFVQKGLTSQFVLLIPIVLCIGLASGVHHFVEKPVIRLLNGRKE